MGDSVDLLLILIVILIIVLIWRGPQMLPQLGEALGRAVKGARDNIAQDDQPAAPTSTPDPDERVRESEAASGRSGNVAPVEDDEARDQRRPEA